MLEWNVSKSPSDLPPEIGMLGAPALQWNAGLGQLGQTPTFTECFDKDPGFTPCWQGSFRQAQEDCRTIRQQANPYTSYDNCVDVVARQYASQTCIPACEAYLRGSGDFPWGVRSDATCEVQRDINSALTDPDFVGGRKTAGTTYRPITVDCKMGPATCGAADFLGVGTPATCQGHPWTAPTPSGAPGPGPSPVPPIPVSGGKKGGGAGLALLGFSALAAIAAAIIGAKS